MARMIYYSAVSLDGYVADAAGSLAWLDRNDNDPDGPLGWTAFDASIGAMVMGRATYDWLVTGPLAEEGAGWPHRQPCWVLTHRPDLAGLPGADVRPTDEPAVRIVEQMRDAAGSADLWCVGGGRTAAYFHAAGLLDEIWLSVAPDVLGGGVPVLPVAVPARLELLDVARNRDFAALRYRVLSD
jgi:dihydrofolate reductase